MPRRPRSIRRRDAIALTAVGIGAWGAVAKAADPVTLTLGGAAIHVRFGPGDFDLPRDELLGWISTAARAVTAYYGRFPVSSAVIEVKPAADKAGVLGGVTYSAPARTQITLGQHTSARQLESDWTMTHELVHMAFPSVPRQHHWIEEGLATYVEPIARAQAGRLSVEKVWGDMVHDMPQGQPGPGDRGLDHTRNWGRTYWGGAMFCLLADVQFRERTRNHRGLQHALRGILAGGNINAEWTIERTLSVGDEAVGVPVLTELYEQMKDVPVEVDLASLWRRLGVSVAEGTVFFQANAPLAAVRAAITSTYLH